MRGELYLTNTVIREIRPLDFKRALDALIHQGFETPSELNSVQLTTALIAHSDLITQINSKKPKKTITPEEAESFIEFNSAFFNPDSTSAEEMPLTVLAEELETACATLNHLGQKDCWNYGWSFFKAVQAIYKED
jgi:hypothetical protein